MASCLLDTGYRLCVYDLSDEATLFLVAHGTQRAYPPAEVASVAEIVLISLPTLAFANDVVLGRRGQHCQWDNRANGNDLSTNGPGVAARSQDAWQSSISNG